MLNSHQFKLANLLALVLIAAILLIFGHVWPVIVLIGQFVLVYFGSCYLVSYLPDSLNQIRKSNCTRADGSHSQRRESIETRELSTLNSNFQLTLVIGVAPWILTVLFDLSEIENATLFAAIWLIASALIMRSGYMYFLTHYVFDLKSRAQKYKLNDLEMTIGREEAIFAAPQKKDQVAPFYDTKIPRRTK